MHHVGRYVYTGALWRIMFVIGVYAARSRERRDYPTLKGQLGRSAYGG